MVQRRSTNCRPSESDVSTCACSNLPLAGSGWCLASTSGIYDAARTGGSADRGATAKVSFPSGPLREHSSMRRPSRRFQAPGEASLGRPAMYDYWRGGDGEVMGHGAGNRQLLMGLSGEPFLFLDREWQKIRPANPKLNMNAATGKGKKKGGREQEGDWDGEITSFPLEGRSMTRGRRW